MDYNTLLDMAVELGYQLAMSGAETFRVEESIIRVLNSYNIQAEVFAIPNCLHVSIHPSDSVPISRMRRVGHHGNNLDAVEKYNSVARRICSECPEPKIAAQWVKETEPTIKYYPIPVALLGHFLAAAGFAIIFGGSFLDSLCAGICGIVIGLANRLMDRFKVNLFFKIIIASFIMAIIAYFASSIRIIHNADTSIIGALMLLVPGLLFTNALRDIIYGDTNSGTNRIVQVFLIAAAIALGTGAALKIANTFWVLPNPGILQHGLPLELCAAFIACLGFTIEFNIHGRGAILCAAGGIVTWLAYRLTQTAGSDMIAYFIATAFASLYAEILARIRKYPAISYLVVSLIPLIPGSGVYYTMNYIVQGNMQLAAEQGTATIACAGAIAVGILLVSTVFRLIITRKSHK